MNTFQKSKREFKKNFLILALVIFSMQTNLSFAQQLVKDILPGSNNGIPTQYKSCNGNFYFFGNLNLNQNQELWKTDGTTAGTVIVKKINPNNGSIPQNGDRRMVCMGNFIYFKGDDGIHGSELWKTDGTEAGTTMVKDIAPNNWNARPENLIVMNNVLYFMAYDDQYSNNKELWKSDGTAAGTVMVKDILPGMYGQTTSDEDMVVVNNILYFIARIATNGGTQLWRTDGTAAGTTMVKEAPYFSPENLKEFNGNLYFYANDEVHGKELWKSDGTTAGTALFKDINLGTSDSSISDEMIVFNNNLYFLAKTNTSGVELWKTGGTASNTVMVKDIRSGTSDGCVYRNPFKQAGGNLYFAANDGINGLELWKTDGTASGTVIVNDLKSGMNGSLSPLEIHVQDFEAIGNTLYFSADNGIKGVELWKTDGTATGTTLVMDIQPPGITIGASSDPALLYNHNGVLYFTANDGVHGRELWALNTNLATHTFENTVMTLYPNPTNSVLNIKTDLLIKSFTVIDMSGRSTAVKTLQNNSIDASSLTKGIYVIEIETEKGIFREKFIKN